MKHQNDTTSWLAYLNDRGVMPELCEKYAAYASKLLQNKVPVIFELEHLARLLGIKLEALASMIAKPEAFYRSFSIKKRRGGRRQIYAPYPSLLSCQRWIYENILLTCPVNDVAHGFVRGRSIVSNALPHVGQKMLLKMDLQDFFPSIPFAWVINFFRDLGYAKNVAYFLTALCCLEGRLAQGAATSPTLANLLVGRMDARLKGAADYYGLNYTRYADDLSFSGSAITFKFARLVEEIVSESGLSVNKSKTKLIGVKGKRIVTGVSVCNEKPKLPRCFARRLKRELFFIKQFGLIGHMNDQKISEPFYLESLIGQFSFWMQVEPESVLAKDGHSYLLNLAIEQGRF